MHLNRILIQKFINNLKYDIIHMNIIQKRIGNFMKRAILFDLDGTLLNTLEDLTDSVNYAKVRFGYK